MWWRGGNLTARSGSVDDAERAAKALWEWYLFGPSLLQGADMRDLRITGHVGFDSFPDQLVTKCVNKGFDFNILCIGECSHHLMSQTLM